MGLDRVLNKVSVKEAEFKEIIVFQESLEEKLIVSRKVKIDLISRAKPKH